MQARSPPESLSTSWLVHEAGASSSSLRIPLLLRCGGLYGGARSPQLCRPGLRRGWWSTPRLMRNRGAGRERLVDELGQACSRRGGPFRGKQGSPSKRPQDRQQRTPPTTGAADGGERVLAKAPKKTRWDLAVVQKPATHREARWQKPSGSLAPLIWQTRRRRISASRRWRSQRGQCMSAGTGPSSS